MKHASANPVLPGTTPSTAGRDVWAPIVLAALAGMVAFAAGTFAESVIIRSVHGNRRELEWLSDTVISMGVAGMTYLWLHLKALRTHVLALERAQLVLDEQLRLAAEIQRSLLPPVPPATPGFRWAARMIPAYQIGGDFYDLIQTADGTVLAILCDVSGKGIPAALILSSLKTLFRAVARESPDPAVIAERMSAALHDEHGGLLYATAIVARFETAPERLAYVSAGHPAGLVLRRGAVAAVLESGGQPLGLLPGTVYEVARVPLMPGDVGVFVTDGITEALDGWPAALSRALAASPEGLTAGGAPAEICDYLLRLSAEGPGPAGVSDWQDDRTVLAFAVEAAR